MKIRPELRAEFEREFQDVSVPLVEAHQGLISASVWKPTRWSPDEYAMVSTWEHEAALQALAGRNWNQAVIPAGMERFVVQCWVHHFEAF